VVVGAFALSRALNPAEAQERFVRRVATSAWRYEDPSWQRQVRRDAARRLVEAVDLPTVAALLGHRRLGTVRGYRQPDQAAPERAAALVETQERTSGGRGADAPPPHRPRRHRFVPVSQAGRSAEINRTARGRVAGAVSRLSIG
jgi:hypothetical protein